MRLFFLTSLLFVLSQGSALADVQGSVKVGTIETHIADGIAKKVDDPFGNPAIQLSLFNSVLKPETKEALTTISNPSEQDFERLGAAQPAVIIMLIFAQHTDTCTPSAFGSYTAVFKRSKAFLIPTIDDQLINLSFSSVGRYGNGIAALDCKRLAHGETLSFNINNFSKATTASIVSHFSNPETATFSWSVNGTLPILDQAVLFRKNTASITKTPITNEFIKSSVLTYSAGSKIFSLYLVSNSARLENWHNAESRFAYFKNLIFELAFKISDLGPNLSDSPAEGISPGIAVRNSDGSLTVKGATANDVKGEVKVSGELKDGATLQISSWGAVKESAALGRPAYEWKFNIKSPVIVLK